MSAKGKALKENLDHLINLFKKFRERIKTEEIEILDKSMYSNLDLLINNYDLIRNNFPDEVFEQMGEPLQNMILDAINQLKKELGITDDEDINVLSDIRSIDEKLRGEKLTSEEIDNLLDARNKLIQKIGK
jgi:hypothetical protein